jgi:sugar lactone lactonase YvrE
MRVRHTPVLALVVTAILLSCASARAGDAPHQKLYWTEEGAVKRSNLDGSGVEAVVQTGENIVYLAASQSANELYYAIGSPTPQLWSADLDGGNRQLLATLDTANYVRGLGFDAPSKTLYWTSFHGYQAGNGKIRSAGADGSNLQDVLALSDGYPYGMAIDPAPGLMFWANTEQNTLERAKLDGSDRQVIGSGVSMTTQLAIDPAANKLYWTDVDDLRIHWSNYDGSDSAVIASPGSPYPAYDSGIAVDHASGFLFWSDTSTDSIYRANLDGSDAAVLIAGGLDNPGSLVVIHNPEPSVCAVFLVVCGAALARRPRRVRT